MSSFWSAARSFSLAGVSQALKKSSLVNKITSTVNAIKHSLGFEVAVDANTIDRIEALLLSADVGPKTTSLILDPIRQDIGKLNVDLVMPRIRRSIEEILIEAPKPSLLQNSKNLPTVVLLTGINGAGKTTTAGKIAGLVASQGKKVVMVPADRFRAAASEQLRVWSERAGVQWFKISEKASDPANVTLRGLQFAKSQNAHVAIVDTAGRLHSRVGLMEELKELVVDATLGLNSVAQAVHFKTKAQINGVVLTKLDSAAKGGAILELCEQTKLPIYYIGTGEQMGDIEEFDKIAFTKSFLPDE